MLSVLSVPLMCYVKMAKLLLFLFFVMHVCLLVLCQSVHYKPILYQNGETLVLANNAAQ